MTLTVAQRATLKDAALAELDATFVALRTAGATGAMAQWYSDDAVPTFSVWKTNVPIGLVGDSFDGAEFAGLTSINVTRLQGIADYSPNGVNPSLVDRRKFFDDIFSGAGGTITRPRLLVLWKRPAKRIEKMFATGTGTDAVPALLVYEGGLSNTDLIQAMQ